jgi:hypothetical protein
MTPFCELFSLGLWPTIPQSETLRKVDLCGFCVFCFVTCASPTRHPPSCMKSDSTNRKSCSHQSFEPCPASVFGYAAGRVQDGTRWLVRVHRGGSARGCVKVSCSLAPLDTAKKRKIGTQVASEGSFLTFDGLPRLIMWFFVPQHSLPEVTFYDNAWQIYKAWQIAFKARSYASSWTSDAWIRQDESALMQLTPVSGSISYFKQHFGGASSSPARDTGPIRHMHEMYTVWRLPVVVFHGGAKGVDAIAIPGPWRVKFKRFRASIAAKLATLNGWINLVLTPQTWLKT